MTQPFKTIEDLRACFVANPASILDVTIKALSELENLGRQLNAVAHIASDDAIARAERLRDAMLRNEGDCSAPLFGIPLAHKDLYMRAGWPCEGGSKALAGNLAQKTAFAVDRLDQQGAVDCGRLTSVEFGLGTTGHNSYAGTPTNPWNPKYICGGSSSGSAAVVAAGIVPASLGSDTGGSVRLPAAACGLVGLKPTHGLVGRSGVIALSPTLDTVGPLTRTVRDSAIVLQAISAADDKDSSSVSCDLTNLLTMLEGGLAGLRIGWPSNYFFEDTEGSVGDDINEVFSLLERLGAECVDVAMSGIETANVMSMLITAVEGASLHQRTILENHHNLEKQSLARLLVGLFVPAVDYHNALTNRASLAKRVLEDTFELVDAVITPIWPYPLPTIEASDVGANPEAAAMVLRSGRNTRPVNYLGFPAVNVPIGFDSNGLPTSVQLIGAPYTESKLLRIARALERELNFWPTRPRLAAETQ
ncbi:MAG: aspartyl-tRNA(Asn)/glutamyl-tRNA(Gln) amidotransferase subunit A [Gammaproteobacteria bacterium]|jgi:aspartyl-tRNA(Asn)/glutamyl-tRNA(Gln) amidotransferase subunit A